MFIEEEGKVGEGQEGLVLDKSVSLEVPPAPGDESVSDEIDYDAEVSKRGAKNIILENKRKVDELATLKRENDELKAKQSTPPAPPKEDTTQDNRKPEKVQAYIDKMKAQGYDDDFINDQIEFMQSVASETAGVAMKPVEELIHKPKLDSVIATISQDEKYKFVATKLSKELESEVKRFPPQYWGDIDFVKSVLGRIAIEKGQEVFSGSGRKIINEGSPTETERGGGKAPEGINADEFNDYATKMGFSTATPELKAKVVAAFKLKKQGEDLMNK